MRLAVVGCLAVAATITIRAEVRTGDAAPAVERYAAEELQRYLHTLFGRSGKHTRVTFLIGSLVTNSSVAEALAGAPFPASPEGYSIIPLSRRGERIVILGGGSAKSALWAVYDLVEQWGVRYLLHGDILPQRAAFRLPTQPIHREPVLAIRQWRVVTELAFGLSSWGIADYRTFLDQLAKLRFNRLYLSLWTHQPFLRYEYGGITRQSSTMFFGFRFPLSSDLPGRSAFPRSALEFENPDILFALDEEARLKAGIAHVQTIMDYGRERGMESVVSANISDFPREFAPLLKDWRVIKQAGELTIAPGPALGLEDTALADLSRTVIRATLNTYPQASRLALSVPEHRQWVDLYQQAWDALDAKYRLREVDSLEAILRRAGARTDYHGGPERAQTEVKGDLVNLHLYDRLLGDGSLVGQSANPEAKFVFSSFAEELAPLLPRVLPKGSELLSFIDYTPSRVLQRMNSLKAVPVASIPSTLILTLHDDNVGPLPQLATHSLSKLVKALVDGNWKGFSTRHWLIGDHDAAAIYLSKAAWQPNISAEQVHRDFLKAICGTNCIPDSMAALDALERATVKLELKGLGFAFPLPGMLMKHWSVKPLDPELLSVLDDYLTARNAIDKAIAKSPRDRRRDLQYLRGRFDFGISYLETVESLRAGALAESRGDRAEALRLAEHALASLRSSVDAYAAVARDPSDRGAIASLNEFGFRPLRQKVKEMR